MGREKGVNGCWLSLFVELERCGTDEVAVTMPIPIPKTVKDGWTCRNGNDKSINESTAHAEAQTQTQTQPRGEPFDDTRGGQAGFLRCCEVGWGGWGGGFRSWLWRRKGAILMMKRVFGGELFCTKKRKDGPSERMYNDSAAAAFMRQQSDEDVVVIVCKHWVDK